MVVKEAEKNKIKQARNRKYKTLIKNQFKKIEVYLQKQKGNESAVSVQQKGLENLIAETQKILDKAKNKKIIHPRKRDRKKRQLYNSLNKLRVTKEVNSEI
ncbi:30S ribosomal protein S20 [endosymbiont DhMRE of Dentiscutata heterogama]|uniref:30S ribosomal protein S20 n=1 Tax=endosymbiont DhMRE of Dentiscutata heterogama TaxID=1609546 RepID=UPI000629DB53|nr:30S ribosomal protein S20 [endosymbiont DhMRE of Dentiscutata heterogama]CFW93023.1 30S ribosomal protein S20 [endosymbiont DhMRE of Dentiscutata heterogama]